MNIHQIRRQTLCGHAYAGSFPVCPSCLEATIGEEILESAKVFARRQEPILIQGETGSGKSMLAEYIHAISSRSQANVQKRGCGDFPPNMAASVLFGAVAGAYTDARDRPGILETLNGGSLILDDIDYMPLEMQQMLLGLLDDGRYFRIGDSHQERRADVRILATSNKDLRLLTTERRFLPDLLARLNLFVLRLPPLRERKDAITIIARFFLDEEARRLGQPAGFWHLDDAASALLRNQPWTENVRELKTVILAIAVQVKRDGGRIGIPDVEAAFRKVRGAEPPQMDPGPAARIRHHHVGERIYRALCETSGNVTQAARIAGCSRNTVYKHIRQHGWVF